MPAISLPESASVSGILDPADSSQAARALLGHWLGLQASLCLSPVLARKCLEASDGDPEAALGRSGRRPGASPREIEDWISELARRGVRALPCTAAAYPARLRALTDPPPLLLVRGQVGALVASGVALVGARAASGYGRRMATELAAALAQAGLVVVSGLARGVDAAAHRGALAGGGRTLAVMGCGPDRIYPPEHAELAGQVADSGAVLSELPPGRPPAAAHFPLRNRLISGLVEAVVVVEARPRSGSLITARHALQQGREVLVVPGRIDSVQAQGSNALLREGARPVLEARDVLEALTGPFRALPEPVRPDPLGVEGVPSGQDPAALYAALVDEPRNRDDLQRRMQWPSGRFALALMELEMAGWVEDDRDGRLSAVPARRRAPPNGA
ncbi:MAG: DNA-processing protein DprA [Myxococcota bacterium]|nr:DNA-processing protein DprA [Myxococcota bacterium]